MKLIAITGSIGCGKTTIAKVAKNLGFASFDVDGWVRRLYYKRDFINIIAQNFPEVVENSTVNKKALRNIVFGDNNKLKILEGLIHPILNKTLKSFIRKNAKYNDLFFLDVALLFEMGWDKYVDFIIVAEVDYEVQKQRVMLRDNIKAIDFDNINDVQMCNKAKKLKSDVTINTETTNNLLKLELINIIKGLQADE